LEPAVDAGDTEGVCFALEGLACVHSRLNPETAAMLWGSLEAWREHTSIPLEPYVRDIHEQSMLSAREALGRDKWEAARRQGRVKSLDEAVTWLLKESFLYEEGPSNGHVSGHLPPLNGQSQKNGDLSEPWAITSTLQHVS
jgi:hypothetical protein